MKPSERIRMLAHLDEPYMSDLQSALNWINAILEYFDEQAKPIPFVNPANGRTSDKLPPGQAVRFTEAGTEQVIKPDPSEKVQ